MFSIFKRKLVGPPPTPPVPWMYLGWNKISYVDKDGKESDSATVHFHARGDGLEERKYKCVGHGLFSSWEKHKYVQQTIIPWMGGDNLWTPIKYPSDNFKDWTEEKHGFVWKGEWWHKPAQRLEGNVIKFPKESEG